jgi:hypothetical protein
MVFKAMVLKVSGKRKWFRKKNHELSFKNSKNGCIFSNTMVSKTTHFVTSKHLGSQNQSILQNRSIFSKLLKYFVFKQGLSVDGSKKFS